MKKIFTLFAALAMVMSMSAETYRYSGEKDGWKGSTMTVSSDGYYSYYGPVTGAHQFKIGTSANQWAYNHSYVSKGFNSTDITDLGDYGGDNAYCWSSKKHYILVYHPSTKINSSSKVKICASTFLPDDSESDLPEPEPEPAELTYNVTVPAGTKVCYINGDMTGWKFTEMTKVDDTHYTITIEGAKKDDGYKYASGSDWGYVEKDANGNEIGNRTYADGNDVVARWASVYDPDAVEQELTYNVTVPAGTYACYIAMDSDPAKDGWEFTAMTKVDETHYTFTRTGLKNKTYKYASGPSWDYVEKTSENGDVADRQWAENDVVAKWQAVYDPTPIYTVNVTAENGTVTGAGKHKEGATATLTANPAEGYEFTCWTSGEDTVSTANPYTFPVTANVALVANFKKAVEEHTITLSGFLKYTNDWREYTTLQNNVEGDTAFFVYNYVDGVPAYGEDYTVTANLGELTIEGTGSWKLIDELETITAVLYNKEGTAVYNVTVSAKAPEVHNLACTDALYVENITAWSSELIITGVIDEDALKISVYDWQEATAGTYYQVMGVLNDEVYIQPESAVVTIVDTKLTIVFSAKDELGNTYNVNVTATPKPNTPLVVENATFTVDGDNLTIQGQWETKSVVVALGGWSTTKYGEYNNAVLMTGTGDAEDDIYAEFSAVLSKDGTTATLTGVAANWDGTKYDVTISGLAPAENPTALDNVDTAVAPAKVINNGQLIIIRNGVQYNAQGAVVK